MELHRAVFMICALLYLYVIFFNKNKRWQNYPHYCDECDYYIGKVLGEHVFKLQKNLAQE